MTALTEFLLARIAEDETAARSAADSKVGEYPDDYGPAGLEWTSRRGMVVGEASDLWDCDGSTTLCTTVEVSAHMARHDPARVIIESAAKRGIVQLYEALSAAGGKDASLAWVAMGEVLKHLATTYEDHPDYGKGWEV